MFLPKIRVCTLGQEFGFRRFVVAEEEGLLGLGSVLGFFRRRHHDLQISLGLGLPALELRGFIIIFNLGEFDSSFLLRGVQWKVTIIRSSHCLLTVTSPGLSCCPTFHSQQPLPTHAQHLSHLLSSRPALPLLPSIAPLRHSLS